MRPKEILSSGRWLNHNHHNSKLDLLVLYNKILILMHDHWFITFVIIVRVSRNKAVFNTYVTLVSSQKKIKKI